MGIDAINKFKAGEKNWIWTDEKGDKKMLQAQSVE